MPPQIKNPNEPVDLNAEPTAPAPETPPAEEVPEQQPEEFKITGGESLAKIADILMAAAKFLDDVAAERDTLKADLENEKSGRAADAETHAKRMQDQDAVHEEAMRMLKEQIETALAE